MTRQGELIFFLESPNDCLPNFSVLQIDRWSASEVKNALKKVCFSLFRIFGVALIVKYDHLVTVIIKKIPESF